MKNFPFLQKMDNGAISLKLGKIDNSNIGKIVRKCWLHVIKFNKITLKLARIQLKYTKIGNSNVAK